MARSGWRRDVINDDGSVADLSETCKNVRSVCDKNNNERMSQVPICDNTNQTFRNPCSLALFNCKRNLNENNLRILVHIGPCHSNSPIFTFQEEVSFVFFFSPLLLP